MQEYLNIENLVEPIWEEPLHHELLSKKIDVSLYPDLQCAIPDKYLLIEEIFLNNELEEIWNNFKPYIEEYKIMPVAETLGDGVICMGYDEKNLGAIYYFDFDFGCFMLCQSLDDFVDHLLDK